MYKLNDVNLLDGKTEFNISITNNGDKDTTLNAITLNFKAMDEKNKLIREGNCVFDNLSIKLPKGKEIYENFVIEDQSWKMHNDAFNISCDFTDVVLNPPLE